MIYRLRVTYPFLFSTVYLDYLSLLPSLIFFFFCYRRFPLRESISAKIAQYSSNGYLDILTEKWYGGLPCFDGDIEIIQPRPLGKLINFTFNELSDTLCVTDTLSTQHGADMVPSLMVYCV